MARARRRGLWLPQNTYRGQTVCSNDVRIFRRALEEKLLDGLQEQVMRPEVIDYVLAKFEAELTNAVDSLSGELEQMRRRKQELEREIGKTWRRRSARRLLAGTKGGPGRSRA